MGVSLTTGRFKCFTLCAATPVPMLQIYAFLSFLYDVCMLRS